MTDTIDARVIDARVLDRLAAVIKSRRGGDADSSYTAKLLAAGPEAICAKITEESGETVEAALNEGPERVVSESADVLYHLLVLWASMDVDEHAVWAELARREGVSGLEEKASRTED